jgi:ribonuclease-3
MQTEQTPDISILQMNINYRFKNERLLIEALTHSTYAYELRNQKAPDNERLEFLGDAVLDLIITDWLYLDPAQFSEGYMTKTRALVVCEATLAEVAKSVDLGLFLRFGRGEETTGGRNKASNLANAVEAIIGAAYKDGGLEIAVQLVYHLMAPHLIKALSGTIVYDYKSRLIELVQADQSNSSLRFVIINEEGPVHERIFTARVLYDEQTIGEGFGSSKKEAEQNAAQAALVNRFETV